MSSSEQSEIVQLPTPSESLHIELPPLEDIIYESSDLSQYQQDLSDVNSALGELQTSSNGHDQQLRTYLKSLRRQIESQSRLLTATASCLRDSECSRSLLEKEVNHLSGAVRSLSRRLRDSTPIGNDAEVATLMEEKIALKSEVMRYKELAGELQFDITRLKARHNAEKNADEEHIQLLFQDMAAKDLRIQQLGEWQIWWQDAMRRRDDAKDDEIQQLRLQLERRWR